MAILFTNNATTKLAVGIGAGATSLTVLAGQGALYPIPSGGSYFLATLQEGTATEIVKVTQRVNDVMTVVRGQEGTSATAFTVAAVVDLRLTAGGLNAFPQSVAAFSGSSLPNGASISGTTLTLGPADGTNPGLVSTNAQTFAGAKTFTSILTANSDLAVGGNVGITGGLNVTQLLAATANVQVGGSLIATTGSFISSVANGSTAKGFVLNTTNSFTTAGAKILSLQTAGSEVASVDRSGGFNGAWLLMQVVANLPTTASNQVSLGSVAGQLAKNENGGADQMVGRFDSATRSASAGAYTPAIKADTAIEIALDADVTLNNPTVSGFATTTKPGCHLVLNFKQDSTGGRLVTWGANYLCNFLQPKQGPNQTSTVHLIQRGDGSWQLVSHNAIDTQKPIRVEDFGLVFDGTTDCIGFIQAAIDFAIYKVGSAIKPSVIMPAGLFCISRPAQLCYGEAQHSIEFCGSHMAERGVPQIGGTVLKCTYSNNPGIVVSGAMQVRVRRIAMVGQFASWISTNQFCQSVALDGPGHNPLIPDTDPANWVDPSLDANQDSRYAPYAGIAVDPYSVFPAPTPHYPNVPYPSYTGITQTYGKGNSTDVEFEDIYVYGFNTGFVVQPGGGDGNGDFIKFRNCIFDSVKWGWSICHTQSRNVDIQNCQVVFAYSALTNDTHGLRTGRFGGTITDLALGRIIHLFQFGSTAFTGPMMLNNLYAESIWRLGDFAPVTSNEMMLKFNEAQCSFTLQDTTRGIPATIVGTPSGNGEADMLFEGCTLDSFPSVAYFQAQGVRFDNCRFKPTEFQSTPTFAYRALGYNCLSGGLAFGSLSADGVTNQTLSIFNVDTLAPGGIVRGNYTGRSVGTPLYARTVTPPAGSWGDNLTSPLKAPHAWDKTNTGTISGISVSGREMTLTLVNLPEWLAVKTGMSAGDVWLDFDSQTVFYVRSATTGVGATVIGVAQNNYKLVGGVETVQGVSTTTGTLYAATSRFYTPQYGLFGDLSCLTPTISNIGRADGFTAGVDVVAGDWIFLNDELESWTSQTQTKVATVNTTTKIMTLAGTIFRAESRMRFPWFIRQPPANV